MWKNFTLNLTLLCHVCVNSLMIATDRMLWVLWCYNSNEISSAVLSRSVIYLYVVLPFESVDEILWCYPLDESSLANLSHGTRGCSPIYKKILKFFLNVFTLVVYIWEWKVSKLGELPLLQQFEPNSVLKKVDTYKQKSPNFCHKIFRPTRNFVIFENILLRPMLRTQNVDFW